MEELIKLIYDYSVSGKLADNEFYYKVIEMVVRMQETDEYLKDVYIIKKEDYKKEKYKKVISAFGWAYDAPAGYEKNEKIIAILEDNLKQQLSDFIYFPFHTEIDRMLFLNLLITKVLLHELEHVNQQKIKVINNEIEGQILRLVDKNYGRETRQTYLYNPMERLAENKAYDEVFKIIEEIKILSPYLVRFFKRIHAENLIYGYGYEKCRLIIPTIKYFELHGKKVPFEWYSANKYKCLSLTKESFPFVNDRLKYGLPISFKEYHEYNKSKSSI